MTCMPWLTGVPGLMRCTIFGAPTGIIFAKDGCLDFPKTIIAIPGSITMLSAGYQTVGIAVSGIALGRISTLRISAERSVPDSMPGRTGGVVLRGRQSIGRRH